MPETKGITMKAMCEHIVKADFITKKDGTKPTAEELFNYSPTGELYMVFEWYKMACELIGKPEDSSIPIVRNSYLFPNGMIATFGENEEQITELQGRDTPELRNKIKQHSDQLTQLHGF